MVKPTSNFIFHKVDVLLQKIPTFLNYYTPRQQDIIAEDFELLIINLNNLARQLNIQVVFSTIAYRFTTELDDNEWTPNFNGFEQPMF